MLKRVGILSSLYLFLIGIYIYDFGSSSEQRVVNGRLTNE